MQQNKDTAKKIRQIIFLLCEGCTNKEIAGLVGISPTWLSELKKKYPVMQATADRYIAGEIKHPFRRNEPVEVVLIWAKKTKHPAFEVVSQLVEDYKKYRKKH